MTAAWKVSREGPEETAVRRRFHSEMVMMWGLMSADVVLTCY